LSLPRLGWVQAEYQSEPNQDLVFQLLNLI
jgi:hypothetical protein